MTPMMVSTLLSRHPGAVRTDIVAVGGPCVREHGTTGAEVDPLPSIRHLAVLHEVDPASGQGAHIAVIQLRHISPSIGLRAIRIKIHNV